LAAIQAALDNGALDAAAMARLLLEDRLEELAGLAENLRIRSAALQFVIGQIIKPLAQDRASRLGLPADDLQWSKGYCPVCGAWPSLSFLFGQEGQRWLKCSFCASEWRYIRTQCPFCENGDLESMEFFFSGDRQWERVEVCHKCKRYVLSLDLRDRVDSVLLEAAPIGMVYLDVLAQEKGFRPGALTEWNVID
jgi:FdhE protein